jgi:hypothetical protein
MADFKDKISKHLYGEGSVFWREICFSVKTGKGNLKLSGMTSF